MTDSTCLFERILSYVEITLRENCRIIYMPELPHSFDSDFRQKLSYLGDFLRLNTHVD